MKAIALVALGGALGAVGRYGVVALVSAAGWHPWGTWVANFVGSFAIGLIVGAWGDSQWFAETGRPFLVIGLLGAFTTFSAFTMDTWSLAAGGRSGEAVLYVVASVGLCLGGAWFGMRFGSSGG